MLIKNIISKAVVTIEHWHVLCDQGVSIAMNTNTDMLYLTQINIQLKNASNILQTKLQQLGL